MVSINRLFVNKVVQTPASMVLFLFIGSAYLWPIMEAMSHILGKYEFYIKRVFF